MYILTRMWYFLVYGMASDALCCQGTRRNELFHWPNKHKIPKTCIRCASWAKRGWSAAWPPRPASSLWWWNALQVHTVSSLCGWAMAYFTLLKLDQGLQCCFPEASISTHKSRDCLCGFLVLGCYMFRVLWLELWEGRFLLSSVVGLEYYSQSHWRPWERRPLITAVCNAHFYSQLSSPPLLQSHPSQHNPSSHFLPNPRTPTWPSPACKHSLFSHWLMVEPNLFSWHFSTEEISSYHTSYIISCHVD